MPGGLANPYCTVLVGEQTEQSNIVPRSNNPVWGSRALTMIYTDLVENGIEYAIISVMHIAFGGMYYTSFYTMYESMF